MSLPKAAMPADLSDALSVVDGLTGSRTDTTSMLFEGRMLGNLGTVPGTRFAQAVNGIQRTLGVRRACHATKGSHPSRRQHPHCLGSAQSAS